MAFNNFINGIKDLWLGTYNNYNEFIIPAIISGSNLPFDMTNADKIATTYTCIRILADTLSHMPLNIYSDVGEGRVVDKQDYRYPILHYQPNNWTSQQTFIATLEYWRNLRGNSFARIYRDSTGKVTSLVLIPPSRVVNYSITNGELYYTLKNDQDQEEITNASEVLHFKTITKDGIWGLNPIESLRYNLSTIHQGLQTIDTFYKNNAMSTKYLKSTVSGANQKAMLEALEEFNKKSGPAEAGKIRHLPVNTDLIFDSALSLADAQFIATMKFNSVQIAALYGVPPHMVGILEATKFNNVETMMLDFKASTLSAIGRMYRQEFESKLLSINERLNGKSIEFNYNALVETDSTTRINNLRTLQGMGVVTPNDVCKLEGFATYPSGDEHYMPGNYLSVDEIASKTTTAPNK